VEINITVEQGSSFAAKGTWNSSDHGTICGKDAPQLRKRLRTRNSVGKGPHDRKKKIQKSNQTKTTLEELGRSRRKLQKRALEDAKMGGATTRSKPLVRE